MKKLTFTILLIIFSVQSFAQWNPSGDNSSTGNLILNGYIQIDKRKQITTNPNDNFTYDNKLMGHYAMTWTYDSWTDTPTLYLSSFGGIKMFTKGAPRFVINNLGNVGIGTANPTAKLDVNGTIRSKEVKIEATGWADFVFDEDYKLPKLSEVESHIKAYKHLPDMPSEKQVTEEGVNVVEMQAKLLQKIEELTLYVIEQDKEIKQQKQEIKILKAENQEIKQQLNK